MIQLQARGGVSTEYPENTLLAVIGAQEQGYRSAKIRCCRTTDGVFMLCCEKQADLRSLSSIQAQDIDCGRAFHRKFTGTAPASLTETLSFGRRKNLQINISAEKDMLTPAERKSLYAFLAGWQDTAALTLDDPAEVVAVRQLLPEMPLHYTGAEPLPETEYVTRWLPFSALTKENAVGAGVVLESYMQAEQAEMLGAVIGETDGRLKPIARAGMMCDMHMHTDNSHDAFYSTDSMIQAEISRNVDVVAVADHCDLFLCDDDINTDIYSNIVQSAADVDEMNKKYGDRCKVLKSVELGEGIWHPGLSRRMEKLLPYDVIIGAVHAVKCSMTEGKTLQKRAYSQINYAELTPEQFEELLTKYFDDVLETVKTVDLDIMPHLICPTGYPLKRHGIYVDLHPYEPIMRKIMETIIEKGIAMEMSHGLFTEVDGELPYLWVMEMYRDMGGYLITVSTDGHSPKEAGAGLRENAAVLKSLGFHDIYYYENRRSYQCTLL